MNVVRLEKSKLVALKKNLAVADKARVHVGLFSDTAGRTTTREGRIDHNPTLGKEHEFGNIKSHMPERSFLRMPLMTRLPRVVNKQAEKWVALILTKGVLHSLKLLGLAAENVVQRAFDTEGFGKWPKLNPRTVREKGSSAILIETAQMRKAIASKVVS